MKPYALLPLLLVAACAEVGPDYTAPTAALPARFVGGDAAPLGAVAARAWWEDYRDPVLTELVARGLAQTLTGKLAQARIAEAQAQLRETGVNAALSGSATLDRTRGDATGTGVKTATSTGLSAAAVLDLFGGLRRAQEGAKASLAGAEAEAQADRLAWLAELIAAYGDARFYQQAVALTRASIDSRRETVTITQHQRELGAATDYEVAEAQALLATAEADLPQYVALYNANVFAIADLLNEPAQPILDRMRRGAPQLRVPGRVPTGVPADLLRNRPDIRYEEASLHAAVAAVGVAEADLYPSLTLSGDITASGGTQTWSFGPALALPLLNHGALAAVRDAKIAAAQQAEIGWRQAVNDAVRDVQVAQSNLVQYRLRAAALGRAAASYGTALKLEREKFRSGGVTLLDLLDVDVNATAAQISAASAANDAAQEWATLQIATGAGAGR